jgi:cytochrome P450
MEALEGQYSLIFHYKTPRLTTRMTVQAMIRPQFTRDQVSNLDLEERHVQNMMRVLDLSMTPDGWIQRIDLLPLFFNLTLDSATEFLFGQSVESQLASVPGYQATKLGAGGERFARAFGDAQMGLATRARFMDKYWLWDNLGFRDSCKIVHEFVDYYVDLALSKDPEKTVGGKGQYVFLEALAAQTRDPVELRSELLHVLLAGRDTTASHLGWSKYLGSCHSPSSSHFKSIPQC